MIYPEQTEPSLRGFWSNMALEVFKNVRELYEQIDTQFMDRAPDEHLGAQMAVSALPCSVQRIGLIFERHSASLAVLIWLFI